MVGRNGRMGDLICGILDHKQHIIDSNRKSEDVNLPSSATNLCKRKGAEQFPCRLSVALSYKIEPFVC